MYAPVHRIKTSSVNSIRNDARINSMWARVTAGDDTASPARESSAAVNELRDEWEVRRREIALHPALTKELVQPGRSHGGTRSYKDHAVGAGQRSPDLLPHE